MNPITLQTPTGTPVGARAGVVHLLHQSTTSGAWGMCGSKLRGNLVERTGDDVTCQACIDEADWAAAKAAKFDHDVYARRRALGMSMIGSSMRYGSEVRCFACLDGRRRVTTIWSTNESGQMRRAEEIARQHFLTAYREHLAQTGD